MQLTLKGIDPQRPGKLRAIHVDSALPEFETLARAAADAAEQNRLELSDATRANFAAAGLDLAAPKGRGADMAATSGGGERA